MDKIVQAANDYFARSVMTPMKVIGLDERDQPDISRTLRHLRGLGVADPAIDLPDAEKVVGADGRIAPGALERDLYPWVRICRIRMRCPDQGGVPSREHCIGTGWFAGPKTIITAGHVVFDNDWPGRSSISPAWGAAADIWIGYHRGTALAHALSTDFRVASAWWDYLHNRPVASEKRLQTDLGCIQLSEPLSDLTGFFDVTAIKDRDVTGREITVAGYPIDRDDAQVLHSGKGPVKDRSGEIFYHHADTGNGQSGAPVWLSETSAQPSIVGIHTGGDTSQGRNWAVLVTPAVKALIAGWVAENP